RHCEHLGRANTRMGSCNTLRSEYVYSLERGCERGRHGVTRLVGTSRAIQRYILIAPNLSRERFILGSVQSTGFVFEHQGPPMDMYTIFLFQPNRSPHSDP